MMNMILIDNNNNNNDKVLDLSIKKKHEQVKENEVILQVKKVSSQKRDKSLQQQQQQQQQQEGVGINKKQMRYKCKFCVYKSHSISLMQNHIYRHIDKTPYSCFYCGHKSTTKSTIMVHIELCHPNVCVKINESRVKEDEFFIDLFNNNNNNNNQSSSLSLSSPSSVAVITTDDLCTNQELLCLNNSNDEMTSADEVDDLTCLKSESMSHVSSNRSNCSSPKQPKQEQLFAINDECEMDIQGEKDMDIDEQKTQQQQQQPEQQQQQQFINRPKQYFGSLYEPDKQYSCKLCTYTTNHKPSMEDHVYVHTNKRPYKCGYCKEEIHTRYAATYHNKYKHPGEARFFIKDEQDVSKYYVNRASSSSTLASAATTATNTSNIPITQKSPNTNEQSSKVSIKKETKQVKDLKKIKVESITKESSQPQTSSMINSNDLLLLIKFYQTHLPQILMNNLIMNNQQQHLLKRRDASEESIDDTHKKRFKRDQI